MSQASSWSSRRRILCAVASVSVGAQDAWGIQKYWTQSEGGLFHDADNWDPSGVPGSADAPVFAPNSADYAVTFADDVVTLPFVINNDTLTVDLAGFRYDVNGGIAIGEVRMQGASPTSPGRLTLVGGTMNTTGTITLGPMSTAAGYLNVSTGATLTAGAYQIGPAGLGEFLIDGGGAAGGGSATIGSGLGSTASGTGVATVTGSGSFWTLLGPLNIAQNGAGSLSVLDGGRVVANNRGARRGPHPPQPRRRARERVRLRAREPPAPGRRRRRDRILHRARRGARRDRRREARREPRWRRDRPPQRPQHPPAQHCARRDRLRRPRIPHDCRRRGLHGADGGPQRESRQRRRRRERPRHRARPVLENDRRADLRRRPRRRHRRRRCDLLRPGRQLRTVANVRARSRAALHDRRRGLDRVVRLRQRHAARHDHGQRRGRPHDDHEQQSGRRLQQPHPHRRPRYRARFELGRRRPPHRRQQRERRGAPRGRGRRVAQRPLDRREHRLPRARSRERTRLAAHEH